MLVVALIASATLIVTRRGSRNGGLKEVGMVGKNEPMRESSPKQSSAIRYKIARSMRVPLEQNKLILDISVEPENFVRDKMVTLSSQLNYDFQNEERIYVVFFDSEIAARNYNPAGGSYSVIQEAGARRIPTRSSQRPRIHSILHGTRETCR